MNHDTLPAAPLEPLGSQNWSIPDHEAQVLRPRRSKYAVCLFVINEGQRFLGQLAKMQKVPHGLDLIVADGGSTDGSMEPDRLRNLGVSTILTKTGPGKLSAQMRMGMAWSLTQGYEGIVVMDGNDKDDPEALPRFARKLDEGFDHIQGSRYIPGGKSINTPLSRHLAVRWLHAPLISLAAGYNYTDTTNGFRAYSRRLLLDPRVLPFRDVFMKYELHYYLAVRSARLGFPICEIPVTRAYPPLGKVPTKIRSLRGKLLILETLFRASLGYYNPTPAEIVQEPSSSYRQEAA